MIEQIVRPVSDADIHDLAALLLDAIDAGASVSFLASLDISSAERWWRQTILNADDRAILCVARDSQGIAGTVQLQPAWSPNQQHRGEIAKLLVHRRARRQGVGAALMEAIEQRARDAGFTLLTLDTKRGDAAEGLYERGGWTRVGVIPHYALNPDGTPCDTVVFYKDLR
ncbi:MAG: GNAT family N-acetyltransferase [Acidobacteriota bacterium]|nr:GNAT family N-acetyltransferase [Acidobacteriota bacterium]